MIFGEQLEVLVLVQWSATLGPNHIEIASLLETPIVPLWFLFVPIGLGHCMAWATEDSSCTAFCAIICRTPRWGAFAFGIASLLTRMIHQDWYLRVALKEYVLRQISHCTYVVLAGKQVGLKEYMWFYLINQIKRRLGTADYNINWSWISSINSRYMSCFVNNRSLELEIEIHHVRTVVKHYGTGLHPKLVFFHVISNSIALVYTITSSRTSVCPLPLLPL